MNAGVPTGRLDAIPLVALVRGRQLTWLDHALLAALYGLAEEAAPRLLERTRLLDEMGRDQSYPPVSDAVDAVLTKGTDPAASR